MLTVTEAASAHLAGMLENADAPDGHAIRVVPSQGSIALQLDTPNSEDQAVEHGGRTVLVLDNQVQQMLGERTLDMDQTENGPALALK